MKLFRWMISMGVGFISSLLLALLLGIINFLGASLSFSDILLYSFVIGGGATMLIAYYIIGMLMKRFIAKTQGVFVVVQAAQQILRAFK
ncbi:MAG TPA: hypothetical protein DCL43_09805 [Chitinophagaceae bacterium]|jgi:hypothetical protein|nr:hypothetical protein [Chitinophagaceae bacterium]HAN40017.1 hypothetical protein [Chitinophagaceae bacterium]